MAELTASERPGEGSRRSTPFYPDFFLLEALTALAFLVVLVFLAALTKPPLGEIADPGSTAYVPRPEWYFLWLFQILKYFKAGFEALGTFVVPAGLVLLLLAVPFLDRREPKTKVLIPGSRPVRVWPRVAGALFVLALAVLTFSAATSMPATPPPTPSPPSLPPPVWP